MISAVRPSMLLTVLPVCYLTCFSVLVERGVREVHAPRLLIPESLRLGARFDSNMPSGTLWRWPSHEFIQHEGEHNIKTKGKYEWTA